MLEVATVKAAVDLFKDLLGLIDKRKQNRREMFKDTFEPLQKRMEEVTREYYSAVSDVLSELRSCDPNLQSIARDLRKRRAAFIIARNSVIGEASAFMVRHNMELFNRGSFGKPHEFLGLADDMTWRVIASKKGELEALSYSYSRAIVEYFCYGYLSCYSWVGTVATATATATAEAIESFPPKGHPDHRLQDLRDHIERDLQRLESNWIHVTRTLTALKIYCQK